MRFSEIARSPRATIINEVSSITALKRWQDEVSAVADEDRLEHALAILKSLTSDAAIHKIIDTKFKKDIAQSIADQWFSWETMRDAINEVEVLIRPAREKARDDKWSDLTRDPEFVSWFGNSAVVDSNGNPLVVFRGMQQDHGPASTKLNTPSFTASSDIASLYAGSGNFPRFHYASGASVTPSFLSIQRPLAFSQSDPSITVAGLVALLGGDLDDPKQEAFLRRLIDEMVAIQHWPLAPHAKSTLDAQGPSAVLGLTGFCYDFADTAALRDWAAYLGYDGFIYLDPFYNGLRKASSLLGKAAKHVSGLDKKRHHLTYRPFRASQIRPVFAKPLTSDTETR